MSYGVMLNRAFAVLLTVTPLVGVTGASRAHGASPDLIETSLVTLASSPLSSRRRQSIDEPLRSARQLIATASILNWGYEVTVSAVNKLSPNTNRAAPRRRKQPCRAVRQVRRVSRS
jgi:hypothetical protein